MLFPTLIVLCVSTHAIHSSKIVKRDLLQSLKIAPASHPLRYPVHPTVQTPTPYEYKTEYGTHMNNPVEVQKLQNPFTRYIDNAFNDADPFYHGQNHQIAPPTYDPKPDFHPDFSVHSEPYEPVRYHQDKRPTDQDTHYEDDEDHSKDVGPYVSGGIPDFTYATSGGMSAPQPGKDYVPHPLEFRLRVLGIPGDHRLKQGYSPVHYRYNGDDDEYSPSSVKCNRYHCPL